MVVFPLNNIVPMYTYTDIHCYLQHQDHLLSCLVDKVDMFLEEDQVDIFLWDTTSTRYFPCPGRFHCDNKLIRKLMIELAFLKCIQSSISKSLQGAVQDQQRLYHFNLNNRFFY